MARISTKPNHVPREVYYSIGTDQTKNIKERIAEVHGVDSEVMKTVNELDHYVADPETRESPWYWNFHKRVKSAMWSIYPHAGDAVRTAMAREYIEDLFNGGYIRALQSLVVDSGVKHARFAQDYASGYCVSVGAALLFGPRGGAIMELLHFLAAENVHGMHRNGTSPHPGCSEQTKSLWYKAQRTGNWPRFTNKEGEEVPLEIAEEQGCLPDGVAEALREMWRRNPALRDYTGTNCLSGDIPFQIIEDVLDMLVQKRFSPLNETQKIRYNQILEQANNQGIDPFYAVYQNLFTNKEKLQSLWNKARNWLYEYSLLLWESQNELWLSEGSRVPASGVVYKPKKTTATKSKKKRLPGTIYLNNGRYYWIVARKMKPRALIDPKSKPKFPGTIFKDGGRYYWIIPGLLKRQRLVPKGKKFSAKDKSVAERIAYNKWKQIREQDPQLAAEILRRTRSQGLATKDKATAEKIAARMWRDIKKNDPELAAKILTDNRPKAEDHWYAQIVVNRKHRFIGSFKTRTEAEAAYAREFEKVFGYPPGYNVQCIPKIDKVWPTWEEEKARLDRMDGNPRMPVIGQSTQTESLASIIERMQGVNWLARNTMLVLDDNSPAASADIAIESRGQKWYAELKKHNKRPVIYGSASLDRNTGRIRITVYNQGFESKCVLAEEIYHIGFKIIRHSKPQALQAIQKWYENQLRNGADTTFSMPDMFATKMALEESGIATSLPPGIVRHARLLFSPAARIPDSVMEKVKTNWSQP